jgi:DNA-binding HxlR family transcriptional regulator
VGLYVVIIGNKVYYSNYKEEQEGTIMSEGYTDVPTTDNAAHGPGKCCGPIRETLSRVGDKWSILIVGTLDAAPLRFNELRRRIVGISQRMLTRTLRELERDGLVSRTVTPTTPPSVEYALNDLGRSLLEPVKALVTWTLANYPQISKAQQRFDKRN